MTLKVSTQLIFLAALVTSTASLSTSWILDVSSFNKKHPSMQECVNAMREGVIISSRASEAQLINHSYIFANKMYSARWNPVDEIFVCYYDGEFVDVDSIKGKEVIKNQLEFRRRVNHSRQSL